MVMKRSYVADTRDSLGAVDKPASQQEPRQMKLSPKIDVTFDSVHEMQYNSGCFVYRPVRSWIGSGIG